MNTLDYLIKQDDQLSQSMPECENINRDGEKLNQIIIISFWFKNY